MMKYEIVFVAACFACVIFAQEGVPIEPEAAIKNEKNCAFQGGICTMKNDCPEGSLTAVKGLCPEQQYMGVECCYGIPISAKSCKSRGGECMSEAQCHHGPRTLGDCPNSNDVCCVLI